MKQGYCWTIRPGMCVYWDDQGNPVAVIFNNGAVDSNHPESDCVEVLIEWAQRESFGNLLGRAEAMMSPDGGISIRLSTNEIKTIYPMAPENEGAILWLPVIPDEKLTRDYEVRRCLADAATINQYLVLSVDGHKIVLGRGCGEKTLRVATPHNINKGDLVIVKFAGFCFMEEDNPATFIIDGPNGVAQVLPG